MRLYTQLNFGGNCEEAFRFYAKHLGGEITMMMKANQMPPSAPKPPGKPDAVIHARMNVAGVELIGNDVPADRFQPVRSSYLYLAVDSSEAADAIYAVLTDGGQATMPMVSTFFASRFAQVRDKFGVLWTILHELPR